MNPLLKMIAVVAALVISISLLAVLFSAKMEASYSTVLPIDTPVISEMLSDFKTWEHWFPPLKDCGTCEISIQEAVDDNSPSLQWSHSSGSGVIKELNISNDSLMQFEIAHQKGKALLTLSMHSHPDGVQLQTTMKAEVENLLGRYMGFFIKGWMLRDIKQMHRNLREILFNAGKLRPTVHQLWLDSGRGKSHPALYSIDTLDLSTSTSAEPFWYFFREQQKVLTAELQAHGMVATFSPYYILAGKTPEGKQVIYTGCTVSDTTGYRGKLHATAFSGKYVIAEYLGGEGNVSMAVDAIQRYAEANQLLLRGAPVYSWSGSPVKEGLYKGLVPLWVVIYVQETEE